ncbi:S-adenosyl-L-methionine-dependent methyltransferase [Dunaliella salina]|uniref:tRNA (guanine(26)-N(2))-dimethyltransferase n=1 Tax=Dunaliella salina TaxID=3046 RepID=A0ABQ7GQ90_DUNSA|nr:S-adenosyl-L-methionine-dependent methyltransferase [Dunaliella salina]|eukprot:KAF5836780.1 S-adenosyl-L-methionine-dependent methyltransferase [Dunaliella salina]
MLSCNLHARHQFHPPTQPHQEGRQQRTRRRASAPPAPPSANAEQFNVQPAELNQERGMPFLTGPAFYRPESGLSRDLSTLAAAVHKRRSGSLKVLDLMAGSGIRSARYMKQAGADVWCNDLDPRLRETQVMNLLCPDLEAKDQSSNEEALLSKAHILRPGGLNRDVWEWEQRGVGANIRVSQVDATRILTACFLNEDFYDVIDIDSFGSDSRFIGSSLDAVKHGGLLYLTSTDGFSAGGHRPARSLAAYGAFVRAGLPSSNENGLRMLIGVAVREGAVRGLKVTPVFSLYSFHGPVFRAMLRVTRSSQWPHKDYGFIGYCHVHGQTSKVPWKDLSGAVCTCCGLSKKGKPLSLSGPIWTGPLHDRDELQSIADEAAARGWQGYSFDDGSQWSQNKARELRSKKNGPQRLEDVLQVMLGEADERLKPGFMNMEYLGKHLMSYPPRDVLIAELRSKGFAASRSHLETKAFRTSATLQEIIAVCIGLGVEPRESSDVCKSITAP